MEEQQLEFSNYNTIDYAMYRHDIEHIAETDNIAHVNKRMHDDGWALLAIVQRGDQIQVGETMCWFAPAFIMGVPRPRFCEHLWFHTTDRPSRSQMIWYHERKEWNCLFCDERAAHNDNAIFDKGLQP